MKVVVKAPQEWLKIVDIDESKQLEELQKLVGGYIEEVPLGDIVIICNEEGKLKGLPGNFFVPVGPQKALVEIVGTVVFMRKQGEDLTSLTNGQFLNLLNSFKAAEAKVSE